MTGGRNEVQPDGRLVPEQLFADASGRRYAIVDGARHYISQDGQRCGAANNGGSSADLGRFL